MFITRPNEPAVADSATRAARRGNTAAAPRLGGLGLLLVLTMALPALGQWSEADPLERAAFQLPETIEVPLADRSTRHRLEQAETQIAEGHIATAIDIFSKLLSADAGGLVSIAPTRYVSVSRWIRIRMAELPSEALAAYRKKVDSLAEIEYHAAVLQRDAAALREVVRTYPLSSLADDALDAMAQMALESGDYAAARAAWEALVPSPAQEAPATWFAYPDSDLPLASIRARLVLVSILEGDASRARRELAAFQMLHPRARGRLAGAEVELADALKRLFEESGAWPSRSVDRPAWQTFAGSPRRQWEGDKSLALGGVAWQRSLPKVPGARPLGPPRRRSMRAAAEDAERPLSYHPVIWNGQVFANTSAEVFALRLDDGDPAWGGSRAIYRDPLSAAAANGLDQESGEIEAGNHPADSLTPPRFTLTIDRGRLLARMGPTATSRPDHTDFERVESGYIACLDLETEGRLLWTATPDDPRFAFEGTPLADAGHVYCAMRRTGIGSRAYVACLDAESGALLWRTHVCTAETPQQGRVHETSHDLLTRAGDTLFYNTNLGAVAAVDVHTGGLQWVSLYPRERRGSLLRLASHWSRTLNPCVYHQGRLYVAPRDAAGIFCFDAADGRLLWQSNSAVQDATYLLGVAGERLIASGDRLYWIETAGAHAGRVVRAWPESGAAVGFGRGVLADGKIYFPTRESVVVFDVDTGKPLEEHPLEAIGVAPGNLVVGPEHVIFAGGESISVLRRRGGPRR